MNGEITQCLYCGKKTKISNGDVVGYIGITEISFCKDCYISIRGFIKYIEKEGE